MEKTKDCSTQARESRHETPRRKDVRHRLLYLEKGVLELYGANQSYLLYSGHAAWLPAQMPYGVEGRARTHDLTFEPRTGEGDFFRLFRVFPLPPVAHEMIRQILRWQSNTSSNENESQFQVFQETFRVMLPVWSKAPLPLNLPATEHPKLKEITRYIRANTSGNLTLGRLSRDFGVSTRSFIRLFRRELGLTFLGYVRLARVVQALELMKCPGATVTETAYEVGYTSLCAFSGAFSKLVGMRPRDYLRTVSV